MRSLRANGNTLRSRRGMPCGPAAARTALVAALALAAAAAHATCPLAQTAFCETFEQGPAPASDRGRGVELSRTRFSTTRYAPSLSTGDGVTFWVWEAEFGLIAEEPPPCRSDVTGLLMPTRDTLVCNPSAPIQSRYLMTAVGSQNYGSNAYRIRQPFDFAGRTGRIVFDTDLASNFLLGYTSVVISEDPSPAPSWDINGRGPNPRNGVVVVFLGSPVEVHDVRDYAMTDLAGTSDDVPRQRGHLSRVELRLSTTQIEVLTSEPSADGIHFGPLVRRRIDTFETPLPFTRGYVSLIAHNHATWKYGITYGGLPRPLRSWNTYWDNIGFDGPVLPGTRDYEVPAALVPHTFTTTDEFPPGVVNVIEHPGLSLGYVIPTAPARSASHSSSAACRCATRRVRGSYSTATTRATTSTASASAPVACAGSSTAIPRTNAPSRRAKSRCSTRRARPAATTTRSTCHCPNSSKATTRSASAPCTSHRDTPTPSPTSTCCSTPILPSSSTMASTGDERPESKD